MCWTKWHPVISDADWVDNQLSSLNLLHLQIHTRQIDTNCQIRLPVGHDLFLALLFQLFFVIKHVNCCWSSPAQCRWISTFLLLNQSPSCFWNPPKLQTSKVLTYIISTVSCYDFQILAGDWTHIRGFLLWYPQNFDLIFGFSILNHSARGVPTLVLWKPLAMNIAYIARGRMVILKPSQKKRPYISDACVIHPKTRSNSKPIIWGFP